MIDDVVHAWFQANHLPWVTALMLGVTWLHGTFGLLAMASLLGVWWWHRGDRSWCGLLLAGVPGAMLLNVALKHAVQRARPVVEHPLLVIDTFSFPSGHAAGTAALYACAWIWLHVRMRPTATTSWMAGAAAAGMVLWVSASRLYLGVHWFSDVLVGMAFGVLWVLACLAVLRPHRKA